MATMILPRNTHMDMLHMNPLGEIETGFNDDLMSTLQNLLFCALLYFLYTSSLNVSVLDNEEDRFDEALNLSSMIDAAKEASKVEKKVAFTVQAPTKSLKVEKKPEQKFTLKTRVKFEGETAGIVIPLCSKPSFLKMLQTIPTLLTAQIKRVLDAHKGEKVLIFVANGVPMAQQIGSFTKAKTLKGTLRKVNETCVGIMKLAKEVVSTLNQEDQDRISYTTWEDLLENQEKYESWYKWIMENEKTRAIVADVAKGICNYRLSSFKKKGIKCASILDEEGNVCDTKKAKRRFAWCEESCGREIVALIWGFYVLQGQEHTFFKGTVYLTPNSTGMDIISGGAHKVLKLMTSENMRSDLPKQAALFYTDLTVQK